MKIGLNGTGLVQKASIAAIVENARQAHEDGFASYWLAEHPTGGFDALSVLMAVGAAVPDIELGTAIVPTMLRHPMQLAAQAATVSNHLQGRLTLGIGLSHAVMMEELGIGFDKPIRHLKEYLSILMPLLQSGQVDFQGETLSARAKTFRPPEPAVPVVAAALGPQALGVTGRLADGTILAWVGPRTVREHIAPKIREAAAAASRPEPRIIATLPVCVTDEPERVRGRIAEGLAFYGTLPSYAAMFEREGVDGPGEVAIVGSAGEVAEQIHGLAEAGVTEFAPSEFFTNPQEREATRAVLRAQIEKG